jgi:hypothetical protein
MIALPAVLASLNSKKLALFVTMWALPAVLLPMKKVTLPLILAIDALPAVLVSENSVTLPDPLLVMLALLAVLALTKKVALLNLEWVRPRHGG